MLEEWQWIDLYSLDEVLWQQNLFVTRLREENATLKDKIEFLTKCLDDRDKSITIMKEGLEWYKEQYEHAMWKIEEENQWQFKDPYLLFIKTIRTTENKSWFYIFKNVKDNNYELRLFNLAWSYPLKESFDTIEWAIEYIETIKHKEIN